MATYIQGLTDYVPQIQPFVPDYNFLGNVLQTKQSRYDAAHKKIGELYGTILDSPMSRTDNISKRDAFFKEIDGQIKQLSGLDLSLQQNQDYAEQIFTPLTEDKHIIKDMTWTKKWQDEMSRGESLRNCIDPDKCGGQYWEGGPKALNYKRQEFMNASADDALNFENVKFTPAQNVAGKVAKFIKDSGFEMKYDHVEGGYIFTDKNGQKMIDPLESYLTSAFATDPGMQAYYKTQAYLERKDFTTSNAQKYGGEDQAALAYVNELYQSSAEQAKAKKDLADQALNKTKVLKQSYAETIKKDKVLPEDLSFINDWNQLSQSEQVATATSQYYNDTYKYAENAGINMGNIKVVGDRMDALIGNSKLQNHLNVIATDYANLTSGREMKADPYGVAKYSSDLALRNASTMEGMKQDNWVQQQLIKEVIEKRKANATYGLWDNDKSGGAGGLDANGKVLKDAPGAASDRDKTKSVALEENTKQTKLLRDVTAEKMNDHLSNLATTMVEQYKRSKDPSLLVTANMIFSDAGINANRLLNGTVVERGQELERLRNMNYSLSSTVFNKTQSLLDPNKTIDPNNKNSTVTNRINSNWTKSFWQATQQDQQDISNALKDYDLFSKEVAKESQKSTGKVAGDYINKNKELEKELLRVKKDYSPEQRARMLADMRRKEKTNFYNEVPVEDKIRANTYKQDLLTYLTINSASGLMPQGDERTKLAARWARESQVAKTFTTPLLDQETSVGNFYSHSLYKTAQEFALAKMDDVAADWTTHYSNEASSWQQLHGNNFGSKSNAKTGTAMQYTFNTAFGDAVVNKQMISTLKNWKSLENGVAAFGNASEIRANDPIAQKAINSIIDDLRNPYTWNSKNKNPLKGDYIVQNVSGYDKNMTSMTITLEKDYIEKNLLKGVERKNQGAAIDMYSQPITLYIPKDKADNVFYNNGQVSMYDYKLQHQIPIEVNTPGAGNVKIVGGPNGYYIEGELIARDPKTGKTETIYIESSKSYSNGLSGEMLVKTWNAELQELLNRNYNAVSNAKSTNGIDDPDVAMQMMLKRNEAKIKNKY